MINLVCLLTRTLKLIVPMTCDLGYSVSPTCFGNHEKRKYHLVQILILRGLAFFSCSKFYILKSPGYVLHHVLIFSSQHSGNRRSRRRTRTVTVVSHRESENFLFSYCQDLAPPSVNVEGKMATRVNIKIQDTRYFIVLLCIQFSLS